MLTLPLLDPQRHSDWKGNHWKSAASYLPWHDVSPLLCEEEEGGGQNYSMTEWQQRPSPAGRPAAAHHPCRQQLHESSCRVSRLHVGGWRAAVAHSFQHISAALHQPAAAQQERRGARREQVLMKRSEPGSDDASYCVRRLFWIYQPWIHFSNHCHWLCLALQW